MYITFWGVSPSLKKNTSNVINISGRASVCAPRFL